MGYGLGVLKVRGVDMTSSGSFKQRSLLTEYTFINQAAGPAGIFVSSFHKGVSLCWKSKVIILFLGWSTKS